MNIMPRTTTSRNVQRNYRKIFDSVKGADPIIILTNNKPDVAIVDISLLEKLYSTIEKMELILAQKTVLEYQAEKSKGKLKELESLEDLA